MGKKFDVTVLGYYGFGNLGDELLADAVIRLLCLSGIDKSRIAVLSADKYATEERLGVKCYDRWDLKTVSVLLKYSKSFLLGGGGIFQDSSSIRSCLYYWWIVRSASAAKARPWAVGQSVGPLKSCISRFFTKNALKRCAYVSVRDEKSKVEADKLGIKYNTTPDLVLGLKVNRDFNRGNNLLLNLRSGYEQISNRAVTIAAETAKKDKCSIIGVALSADDENYMKKLEEDKTIEFSKIIRVKNLAQFENVMSMGCKAIGMRLHFAELSAMCGTPTAVASYDPKVDSFCKEWDIPLLTDDGDVKFSVPTVDRLNNVPLQILNEFKKAVAKVIP